MAPGFSFPPPPPPPPKAAAPPQDYAYDQNQRQDARSERGGRGRGRGRGRGGQDQRGGHQQTNHYQAAPSHPHMNNLPGGTHINPAFRTSFSDQSNGGPSFQNSHSSYGNGYNQKRKREDQSDDASGSWKHSQDGARPPQHHPMKRPEIRQKAEIAPSVPSFGSPIFSPASAPTGKYQKTAPPQPITHQSKGTLGLVPHADDDDIVYSESEEEDDVDEEAAFQASNTGALTFEYNGEVAKLESQQDIKQWIEQRRKMWPSRRRIEEKQAEVQDRMDERKRIEAETRAASSRRNAPEPKYPRHEQQPSEPGQVPQKNGRGVEALDALEAAVRGADKHDGVDLQSAEAKDSREDDSVVTEPDAGAPIETGLGSDKDDEDSAPEVESSKTIVQSRLPPAPPRTCNVFAATGRCKFGSRCRYQHVGGPQSESNVDQKAAKKQTPGSSRKSLFDRMVDQEKDEDDALALQAIKYLGNLGFYRQMKGAESET